MAFDAGYADKINNALEEYRQDESEMRQNAPGAENFNTEAEGTKKPEIKKEPVDGSVEITFDPDGMTANMILHKAYNGGRPVTAAIVMAELLKKGINTGIDDLDIKDMVDGGVYETPICVARAIPPKRGENDSISFRYEKKRVPKPQHDEFGVADFRELNLIVPIHKGDIIADIKQPTPGEPGVNIFGRAIMPEPGKMPNITVGKNTLMTADGKYIVSACDGHIMYGTGCFNVEDTVTVKSDLDISVGNIDFFGDIYIKGNVMEGFSVKAGRSLKIEGTVFSADLAAGGDIVEIDLGLPCSVTYEGDVLSVRTPVGAALVRARGLGDVPRDSLSDRHIEDLSAGCDGHSLAIWGKAERRAAFLADIHPFGTGIDKVGAKGDVDPLGRLCGRIQLIEVASFLEHNESAVRARELHIVVVERCHLGRGFGLRVVNE